MTEKRFRIDEHMLEDTIEKKFYTKDKGYVHIANVLYNQMKSDESLLDLAEYVDRLQFENEQLKQQLQIFEKFLEGNDLSIDWEEFCGLEECAFENPNFSCKSCIYLKW